MVSDRGMVSMQSGNKGFRHSCGAGCRQAAVFHGLSQWDLLWEQVTSKEKGVCCHVLEAQEQDRDVNVSSDIVIPRGIGRTVRIVVTEGILSLIHI